MRLLLKVVFAAIVLIGIAQYVMPVNQIMVDIRTAAVELWANPIVQKTIGKAARYVAQLDDASKITLLFLVIVAILVGGISMLFSLRAERKATRRWRNLAEVSATDSANTKELVQALARVQNGHAKDVGQMLRDNPDAALDALLRDVSAQLETAGRLKEVMTAGGFPAKVMRLRQMQRDLKTQLEPIEREFGSVGSELSEMRRAKTELETALGNLEQDEDGNDIPQTLAEVDEFLIAAAARLEAIKTAVPRLEELEDALKKLKKDLGELNDDNDGVVALIKSVKDMQKEVEASLDALEDGSGDHSGNLEDQVDDIEQTKKDIGKRAADVFNHVSRLQNVLNGSGTTANGNTGHIEAMP